MRLDLLRRINRARAERRAYVLETDLASGEQSLHLVDEIEGASPGEIVEWGGRRLFISRHRPAPRLVIVGAVHVAQALAPMARMAAFEAIVVDPREAFANAERFPNIRALALWPQEAFAEITLDARTAVAALTHDPKIDDPALIGALAADCFYVGALGSSKTHQKRIARLEAAGVDRCALARIHAPIGLDIGASTPAEIAVSILGEIIQAQRTKPPRAARTGDAAPLQAVSPAIAPSKTAPLETVR